MSPDAGGIHGSDRAPAVEEPGQVNGQGSARAPAGGEPHQAAGGSPRDPEPPPSGKTSGGDGGRLGWLPGGASTLLGLGLVVVLGIAFAIGFSIANEDGDAGGSTSRALTADDLARYASGSPEREVIEWWRDIQFGNPGRVETHYASEADTSVEELEFQLTQQGTFFEGVPRVDDVDRSGDVATVYMLVVGSPGGGGSPEPVAVRLVREGTEWKLVDNHLLEELVSQREQARAIGDEPPVGSPVEEPSADQRDGG